MKNNLNITTAILVAAFITVTVIGLCLSGFLSGKRSSVNPSCTASQNTKSSRNGRNLTRIQQTADHIPGRTSITADDGNRFPDIANLDNEDPIQPALLQLIKETENKGCPPSALALLLKEALSARHGATTRFASDKLVSLGDEAVPELMSLLDSEDRRLGSTAFSILGRIGTAKALVALIGKILSTTDSRYAAEMEKQFAGIQTPAVTDTLLRLLKETDQPAFKAKISSLLSSMEGAYIVSALNNAIAVTVSLPDKLELISILARLNKASNIPQLKEILALQKDITVQEAASVALANIGNAEACKVLAGFSDDPRIGSSCRSWLATVNSPYGQQALLDILKSDATPEVRASAAAALGNYISSDLLMNLQNFVTSEPDKQVQNTIQQSITTIKGNIPAIPAEIILPGEQNGETFILERTQ